MPRLPEEAFRILSVFEEDSTESVLSMLNTIFEPSGDLDEVWHFQRALIALVKGEYVTLGLESFVPRNIEALSKEQAKQLIASLQDDLSFDSSKRYWGDGTRDMLKDRYPVIHLTDGGEAVAREVVDDRGRLWWLPAKRSLNFRKRPYTG